MLARAVIRSAFRVPSSEFRVLSSISPISSSIKRARAEKSCLLPSRALSDTCLSGSSGYPGMFFRTLAIAHQDCKQFPPSPRWVEDSRDCRKYGPFQTASEIAMRRPSKVIADPPLRTGWQQRNRVCGKIKSPPHGHTRVKPVVRSHKMSVASKLENELLATERELYRVLMRVLPHCAETGTMLFFNSQNLPDDYQRHWLPQESDQLLELASRCTAIREKLKLPIARTLSQLFLDACAENANVQNPHRRGPRKLAAWLLAELQSRFATSLT